MLIWAARIAGSCCLLGAAIIAALVGFSQTVAALDLKLPPALRFDQASDLLARAEAMRLSESQPSEAMAETAAALLRRAPLMDAPLVYAGLARVAKGDDEEARSFFLSAIKRQPRNVLALSWLAADAVRSGDLEAAGRYLDRLWMLSPQERPLYAEILAAIVTDFAAVDVLESRLIAATPLAEAALDRLNTTSNDITLLLRLNMHSTNGQSRLIGRLFKEQGATPAFIAWLSLAPGAEARALSWPLDPVFLGSNYPLPFNWEISGGAELLKEGGLYVSYSGREPAVFAEQVMMLTPGSYTFRATMDGETTANGGMLEWTVACHPGGQILGALTPQDIAIVFEHDLTFAVPPGDDCAAQRLTLSGRPGELPSRARANVRRVRVQTAGLLE